MAYTVAGRLQDPHKDQLVFVQNPIEAEMPGHWVPLNTIKVILGKKCVMKKPNCVWPGSHEKSFVDENNDNGANKNNALSASYANKANKINESKKGNQGNEANKGKMGNKGNEGNKGKMMKLMGNKANNVNYKKPNHANNVNHTNNGDNRNHHHHVKIKSKMKEDGIHENKGSNGITITAPVLYRNSAEKVNSNDEISANKVKNANSDDTDISDSDHQFADISEIGENTNDEVHDSQNEHDNREAGSANSGEKSDINENPQNDDTSKIFEGEDEQNLSESENMVVDTKATKKRRKQKDRQHNSPG